MIQRAMIVLAVLAMGVACGCTQANRRFAAQYCLVETGVACSPVMGDGTCQPCPTGQQ